LLRRRGKEFNQESETVIWYNFRWLRGSCPQATEFGQSSICPEVLFCPYRGV
jgi:hypothetical protein